MKGSKDCWFVLTSDNLSWYKDDEVIVSLYLFTTFIGKRKKIYASFGWNQTSRSRKWLHVPTTQIRIILSRRKVGLHLFLKFKHDLQAVGFIFSYSLR